MRANEQRATDPAHQPGPQRARRLIKPRLQLRLVAAFFGVAVLALMVQFSLFGFLALRVANRLPDGGEYLINEIPSILLMALGGSLLVLLPALLLVGVAVTFPIVGPIYRFEAYFRGLADGGELEPCRIRQDDQLHGLCDAINEALQVVRQAPPVPPGTPVPADPDRSKPVSLRPVTTGGERAERSDSTLAG